MKLEKLLYSISAVCQLLGLSRPTVMDFIKAGQLPARRLGGRIMIHHSTLEKFARTDTPLADQKRAGR